MGYLCIVYANFQRGQSFHHFSMEVSSITIPLTRVSECYCLNNIASTIICFESFLCFNCLSAVERLLVNESALCLYQHRDTLTSLC